MKTDAFARDGPTGPWARFFGMACLAMLARVASTEVHESCHFLVGRLAGLPADFLTLTSVGVEASVAARAPRIALALMNGAAPVITVLLGILALKALPAVRRKAPAAVTGFLAWWAITGIPYMGLQLMTTAGPIRLRGDGSDSAAVIGGYLGAGIAVRSVISLAGFLLWATSGFWLGAAVAARNDAALLTLRQKLRGLPAWRLVVSSILGLLLIAVTVRAAMSLVEGDRGGLLWLLLGTLVWSAMMAFLVQWSASGAREVRARWIFPGLLASAGVITIGLLTHLDDFVIDGVTLTMPLLATAWMLMRESPSVIE